LIPAATTLISTSPSPGLGTGRSTIRSTSGPPGCSGSIARITVGIAFIRTPSSETRPGY